MAPKEPVLVFEMPFLGFYFLNAAALLGAGPLPDLFLASPFCLLLFTGRRVAGSRTSSFTWQVGVLAGWGAGSCRGDADSGAVLPPAGLAGPSVARVWAEPHVLVEERLWA